MDVLRRCRPLALLGLAAALAACAPEPEAAPPPAAPPERIVAVSPSLCEILFALGQGERVVGVGDFVRWPREAAERTRIGGLFDPRLEQIVTLEPDLAVLLPSEQELAGRLEALGVEVLTLPSETLEDVAQAALAIGRRTGAEASAERFVADWRRQLAPDPVPGEPVVLLSLARESGRFAQLLAAGPDTFLDELLGRAGAVNAFADAPIRYPQIGPEAIVERRPAVVLELQPEQLSGEQEERLVREWDELLEPQRTCVRVISGDHVLLPGPRLPRLYRELREAIAGCASGGDDSPAGA